MHSEQLEFGPTGIAISIVKNNHNEYKSFSNIQRIYDIFIFESHIWLCFISNSYSMAIANVRRLVWNRQHLL